MTEENQAEQNQCFGSVFTESGSRYFSKSGSGSSLLLTADPFLIRTKIYYNKFKKNIYIIGNFLWSIPVIRTPTKDIQPLQTNNFLNFTSFGTNLFLPTTLNPDSNTEQNSLLPPIYVMRVTQGTDRIRKKNRPRPPPPKQKTPPSPSSRRREGRYRSYEEVGDLPTGIGERYSQHISIRVWIISSCRRQEFPLKEKSWTTQVGPP